MKIKIKSFRLFVCLLIVPIMFSCRKEKITLETEKSCCKVEVALPDVKSEIITLGEGKMALRIEKKGDVYVMGGDMIISNEQLAFLRNKYKKSSDVSTESTFTTSMVKLWPSAIVYYSIDASLPASNRVAEAIAHWESRTPLRFIQRTNQPNYVFFVPGSGCSSKVGMVGGMQTVTLEGGCSTGNTIHEIGHVIGFFHEQSRTDRQFSIIVHPQNIAYQKESNFDINWEGTTFHSANFDFSSIMLYGSYDFSSNGQPTITKLDGSTYTSQRDYLSTTDIEAAKYMYQSNPNGLICARIEFQNIVGSDKESYADAYIAFYTNYQYNVPVVPPANITFNAYSILLASSNYSTFYDEGTRINYSINNTNGQSRIFLDRRLWMNEDSTFEDPQYGNYTMYYTTPYVVTPGTGYNPDLSYLYR